MRTKDNGWETFWYCFVCICSLGVWYTIRIVMTIAIKKAIDQIEQ